MKTITFYSYKGGTGRSLLLANIARYLAQLGLNVFVIDFDLEAPGLHYKLSPDGPEKPLAVERGLVDYLVNFLDTSTFPESMSEYVLDVSTGEKGALHLLPAGRAPHPSYWRRYSRIDWRTLFFDKDSYGIHLFLEIKEQIRAQYAPDFLLIDARTGVTDIGGLAASFLCDTFVCLTLDNRETLDGTRGVLRGLSGRRSIDTGKRLDLRVVLARVQNLLPEEEEAAQKRIRSFLNEFAEDLEKTLSIRELFPLHNDGDLARKERVYVGSDRRLEESRLLGDYLRLCARLVPEEVVARLLARSAGSSGSPAEDAERQAQAVKLGHPLVYRELLRTQLDARSDAATVLANARRLWLITRDSSEAILGEALEYAAAAKVSLKPIVDAGNLLDWAAGVMRDTRTASAEVVNWLNRQSEAMVG